LFKNLDDQSVFSIYVTDSLLELFKVRPGLPKSRLSGFFTGCKTGKSAGLQCRR